MTDLRLLGSGSKDGGCPALYATETSLVVQGTAIRNGTAVLVPHKLLDWAEPGTTLRIETTDVHGVVLVSGRPVHDGIRSRLTLNPDETAVEVPQCGQ